MRGAKKVESVPRQPCQLWTRLSSRHAGKVITLLVYLASNNKNLESQRVYETICRYSRPPGRSSWWLCTAQHPSVESATSRNTPLPQQLLSSTMRLPGAVSDADERFCRCRKSCHNARGLRMVDDMRVNMRR